jgi:hypothetical protein
MERGLFQLRKGISRPRRGIPASDGRRITQELGLGHSDFPADAKGMATRVASGKVLNAIARGFRR